MKEQEHAWPGGADPEGAQFDASDVLNAAQKYRERQEALDAPGPNAEPTASEDAEARRRKLLEQILEDGARVADMAASSPRAGQSEVPWLLQVHKLQNVLNNQIYGMCLGLLNSSLTAM